MANAAWLRSLGSFLVGLVIIWLLLQATLAASYSPGVSLGGGLVGLLLAWRVKLDDVKILRLITLGFSAIMLATGLALLVVA